MDQLPSASCSIYHSPPSIVSSGARLASEKGVFEKKIGRGRGEEMIHRGPGDVGSAGQRWRGEER